MQGQCTIGEDGFTLVELLVAISLLAIVSGLFVNTVLLSQRMAGVNDTLLSARELDLLQSHLRQELRYAVRLFRADRQADRQQVVFQGHSNRLDLVLPAKVDVEYGGLRHARFQTETGPGSGFRFVTHRHPGVSGLYTTRPLKASRVVLLDRVEAVSFRYFGTRHVNGRPVSQWFDTWERIDRLPQLVELTIVRQANDHRISRKIIIDLPIAR